MKYQALKGLKTKTKVLGIYPTLKEAHERIKQEGAEFKCFSYMGGFPSYIDSKNYHYNIQGQHEQLGIVLSLNKEELLNFNFK